MSEKPTRRRKVSQRAAAVVLFGFAGLVYLANFALGGLPDHSPRQYALGGLLLVALGVGWAWLLGRPATLRLDRARNTCRLSTPLQLFGAGADETFPLERVRCASVCEVTLASHDGPGGTGYEVRLETKDGRAVLISTESSRRTADALARRLKDFLRGRGGETLTVRRFPWIVLAFGFALAAFGALLILSAAAGWPFPS